MRSNSLFRDALPKQGPQNRLGADPDCLVRIECTAGADMLGYTHAFFSSYCEGQFRSNIAQKVTVAAFELLENGLKYGGITQKVVVELLKGKGWLALRVSNDAIPARIAMLNEQLERIRTNAEAVFVEEMRKSMSGTGQRAMLGLARLAHEAKLDLVSTVEDRHVTVEAFCRD